MLSTVGMNGYSSTMDFVQEFGRHFKIAKICDNSHIADCWPTEKVIVTAEGKEWKISDTKSSKNLKMPQNKNVDWNDTVGIVTADGTGMILSYNKKCDKSQTEGLVWSSDSSSSNTCIAAVFDWNGGKKPNKLAEDVLTINAGGLGECTISANGKCFTASFKPSKIASCDETTRNDLQIKHECRFDNDYWAGAVAACGGIDNMPTASDLNAIRDQIYGTKGTYDSQIAISLGFPEKTTFGVWSASQLNSAGAGGMWFGPNSATHYGYYRDRNAPGPLAICKV